MHPIVLLAFILSGISSLTLEIIWTRYLEHVFGATTLAISTVLTCFMGGLALGSWLFGKFADRLKSPVLGYGLAEGVVGLSAFVIPMLIHNIYPGLNRLLVDNLSNNFLLFSFFRFILVAIVLIIPTTCMGATLPLLSRHFIQREGHMMKVGSRVGTLYTLNTLGAIGGVFTATFVLLPHIGLAITNMVAGTINITLCLVILIFRKQIDAPRAAKETEIDYELEVAKAVEGVQVYKVTKAERLVTMGAFLVSGLASMNLQVVWNRAMAMVIGSSVYSFAIVLLAFLVGLAIGSALLSRWSKSITNPVMALALVELAITIFAIGSYTYMDDLPKIFAKLVTGNIQTYEEHVGLIQFIMFTIASFAVLPVTIGMGATFPLTIKIIATGLSNIGKDVGRVYALNTLGAIFGSFLSAFVFVPFFSHYFNGSGMQTSFFLSVILYAILGFALLLVNKGARIITRIAVATPAAIIVAAFLLGSPGWDPAALTVGVFRISLMKNALDEESWGDPDIKHYYDGVTTTVSVEVWGRHFALKNNGKVDASNGDDMPTQIMVAAYPLLFHPNGPKDLDVAIIGYGSGVTVGAALEFPVKKVDCIELENAVVDASNVFGKFEGNPDDPEFDVNHMLYRRPINPETGEPNPEYDWTDPDTYVINDRLHIFNNDGRNFLATTEGKYDVIISEPSNPWITGVSNMFTKESFASSAKALKPGGIFGQWVQLYEMSPGNIKTIFRTFASVYPHVALFTAEDLSSDTILIGSFEPLNFNLKKLEKTLENDKIAAEMGRAYVFSAADVYSRVLLINKEELLAYTNESDSADENNSRPINTDDNAVIEFSAPKDLISFRKFAGYLATIYTDSWKFGKLHKVLGGLGEGEERVRRLAAQAISLLTNGRKREARIFINVAAKHSPKSEHVKTAQRVAALMSGQEGPPMPDIEAPQPSPGITDEQKNELSNRVNGINLALKQNAYRDALERFSRIPDHLWRRGGPQMMLLKGYLHFSNADPEDSFECKEAIEVLSQLVREHERYVSAHPEVHFYLGLCHDNALHFDKAVKNISTYVALNKIRLEQDRITLAQSKANLDALLKGFEGTASIKLPADAPSNPTTDARGESPKTTRNTSGFSAPYHPLVSDSRL